MRFYTSGYNFELKDSRDEPNKLLSALQLAECDFDGVDVQYGLDDLPIEKVAKTSASKTSATKTPASSSQDIPEKVRNPVGQMIDISLL